MGGVGGRGSRASRESGVRFQSLITRKRQELDLSLWYANRTKSVGIGFRALGNVQGR